MNPSEDTTLGETRECWEINVLYPQEQANDKSRQAGIDNPEQRPRYRPAAGSGSGQAEVGNPEVKPRYRMTDRLRVRYRQWSGGRGHGQDRQRSETRRTRKRETREKQGVRQNAGRLEQTR